MHKEFFAGACVMASIVIACLGMAIEPQGVIDTSVLYYTAQLLLFAASCLGLDVFVDRIKGMNKRN